MTFEEDFPSLKGKHMCKVIDGTWFYYGGYKEDKSKVEGSFTNLAIQEHCLDKQKVISAINSVEKFEPSQEEKEEYYKQFDNKGWPRFVADKLIEWMTSTLIEEYRKAMKKEFGL